MKNDPKKKVFHLTKTLDAVYEGNEDIGDLNPFSDYHIISKGINIS